MPEREEIDRIENKVGGLFSGSNTNEVFKISEQSVEDETYRVQGAFSSPFGFSMELNDLVLRIEDGERGFLIGTVGMEGDSIPLDPGEEATVRLSGNLAEGARDKLERYYDGRLPSRLIIVDGTLEFEASDIDFEITLKEGE